MKDIEYVIAYLKKDNKKLDKLFLKESSKRRASVFEAGCYIENSMQNLVDCYPDNKVKFKKHLLKWTIKVLKETIKSKHIHINDNGKLSVLIEQFFIKTPEKFVLRTPLWITHKTNYNIHVSYSKYVDSQFSTYVSQIMNILGSMQ